MKRVVIANFVPIWPAQTGGHRRVFFLARELSNAFDVEVAVPDWHGLSRTTDFSPTLRETRVETEPELRRHVHQLERIGPLLADVGYGLHWQKAQRYQAVLTRLVEEADAVVTTHPYSIYALEAARGERDIPLVFDSQNFELEQKRELINGDADVLKALYDLEAHALRISDKAFACSEVDRQNYIREYGVAPDHIALIENGVDARSTPVLSPSDRSKLRAELGLNGLVTIFGGSYHVPNFSAVDPILEAAREAPDVTFLMLGTICDYQPLAEAELGNLRRLGRVSEKAKWMAFALADVGLNPMTQGSGTNIKMHDYAASALAIASSEFGARGVPLTAGIDYHQVEPGDLGPWLLEQAGRGDLQALREMGAKAREQILRHSDWSAIGKLYVEEFQALLA
ncbi:MAG: glycosyltransferase [Pseudomonadota bacterium]